MSRFVTIPAAFLVVAFAVACGNNGDGATDPQPEADVPEMDLSSQTDLAVETVEDVAEERDDAWHVDTGGEVCVPDCDGKVCGPDGCGDLCGYCAYGYPCNDGQCTCDVCTPSCQNIECGLDEYGNVCGTCDDGMWCLEGTCMDAGDVPNCDGRECGNDGLGGSCGECTDGQVCNELSGQCLGDCTFPDDLPATFGTASVVNYLHVPETADETAVCFDYTGDGAPDSGISSFATQLNPEFDKVATGWTTSIVLEYSDIPALIAPLGFQLSGLIGRPVTAGSMAGDMLVDPASWNPGTCHPYIFFENTAFIDGAFSAYEERIAIFVNLSPTFALRIDLIDARVNGTFLMDESGVSVTDGLLMAVITQADLYSAIERLQAECDKVPQPEDLADVCQALDMVYAPGPRIVGPDFALLTMHRDETGHYLDKDAEHPGNAGAICLRFAAVPAVITGYSE